MREPIFPIDGIPKPWAQLFDELTNKWTLESLRDSEFDAERALSICHRVHLLHWVVKLDKNLNPNHCIPFRISRKEINSYKPLGKLYHSALAMCALVAKSEIEAAGLFFKVVVEGAIEHPQISINQKNRVEKSKHKIRKENQELRDRGNPFSQRDFPGTHCLLKSVMDVATNNPDTADFLDEFLIARKNWVKTMGTSAWHGLMTTDDGQLRLHLPGRGRGTSPIKLNLPESQKEAYAKYAGNELARPSIPPGMGSLPNDIIFNIDCVASNPIGLACLTLLGQTDSWKGTASEFLFEIKQIKGNQNWGDEWPSTPESLGKKWNELIPKLNRVGIDVSHGRMGKNRTRVISLSRRTGQPKLKALYSMALRHYSHLTHKTKIR